jgi:hypothetical protein
MKSLLELIKNPYAVIFAISHWSLVVYLLFEKQTRPKDGFCTYGVVTKTWQDELVSALIVIDLPAILFAKILWLPIQNFLTPPNSFVEQDSDPISALIPFLNTSPSLYLFGEGRLIPNEVALISIVTITLQWLIIGKIFSGWLASIKSKAIILSLNDE